MSAMDHYKVFYYTVKTGSISGAAQQLYITQPSASYAVKQLEEHLGVRLLVRKSKGVEVTDEGRVLFRYVEQAYALMQAGERKIGEMKSLTSGTIRLGASDSLCKHYLLPFLERFHAEYPGIRICLSHGKTEEITKRLTGGVIDCGVVHLPADERVQVRVSKPVQTCIVAGPKFAHLAESPISLKEAVRHPFVMLSEQSRTREFFHALLNMHGLDVTPDIELGSVDLLIEFVRKGMGISLINKDFVKADLEAGTLFELRVAEPIPPRCIGVVTQPDFALSTASAFFIQKLIEHIDSF